MGEYYFFLWFGKSVDELKAIRETEKLTEEQLKKLDEIIAKKEQESEQYYSEKQI